jgi:hypothetical protein
MTPFSKYVNCLNCGNELTHLSKLAFNAPSMIECDFCGQKYPGLSKKIKRIKWITGLIFIFPTAVIFLSLFFRIGATSALFAMFPLFIIYLYVLAFVIKKSIDF